MKKLSGKIKALCLGGFLLFLLTSDGFAQVAVSTSTTTAATGYPIERKTWYDGTEYWTSYYDGTSGKVQFWYSTNGSTWTHNTNADLSDSNIINDFSIEADSGNAFIIYTISSFGVYLRKASSYPGTSFSWDSATAVFSSGGNLSANYGVVTRDSNNYLWALYIVRSGIAAPCFVQGAKVYLADGRKKNIEDLVKGDELLGFDNTKVTLSKNKALKLWPYQTNSYLEIKTRSSIVKATANHLFFTGSRQYMRAGSLKLGEILYTIDSSNKIFKEPILDIKVIKKKVTAYDISTDNFHNMIVDGFCR